jgi:hypothetical protein
MMWDLGRSCSEARQNPRCANSPIELSGMSTDSGDRQASVISTERTQRKAARMLQTDDHGVISTKRTQWQAVRVLCSDDQTLILAKRTQWPSARVLRADDQHLKSTKRTQRQAV